MTDFQKVGVVSNGIRGIRGINDCRNDDAWKFSFGFWRTIEEVCRLGTLRMLAWDLGICVRGLSMVQKVDG